MSPLFQFQKFFYQPWYTLHGGPALLLRIKSMINISIVCITVHHMQCEICPRSIDNLNKLGYHIIVVTGLFIFSQIKCFATKKQAHDLSKTLECKTSASLRNSRNKGSSLRCDFVREASVVASKNTVVYRLH